MSFWEPRFPGHNDPESNCHDWTDRARGLARWSPPQVKIIDRLQPEQAEAEVNAFLVRPDVHILAISAADPATEGGASECWSRFVLTVIYQERLPVNGAPDDEDAP